MADHSSSISHQAVNNWRRRLGLRGQIVAGLILAAVVAGAIANGYFAGQYGPAGAARTYVSALQAGDADRAWAAMKVADPTGSVDARFTDRSSLAAALATARPSLPGFTIARVVVNGPSATVDYAYSGSSGAVHGRFMTLQGSGRQLGIYPAWQVLISPALLTVTIPSGSSGLTVDGRSTKLTAGARTVGVLPLEHRVQILGSKTVEGASQVVDALPSAGRTLGFSPAVKLTPTGDEAARAAIKAALAACAAGNDLTSPTCPQRAKVSLADQLSWQLVGDPTSPLAIQLGGSDPGSAAIGHYQMVLSYHPSYGSGTAHEAVGGAYRAGLRVTESGVDVTTLAAATGIAATQRPAGATDQAAKDLVAAAFARCATATSITVNDCPQSDLAAVGNAKNVAWTLSGDPIASSTVTFDGDRSVLNVSGSFSMSVDYDLGGTHYKESSTSKQYRADLFWDGTALQLITIVST